MLNSKSSGTGRIFLVQGGNAWFGGPFHSYSLFNSYNLLANYFKLQYKSYSNLQSLYFLYTNSSPLQMEIESFTRGALVWARVVYPHQWWPGLVLTTNRLGILVSFFGCLKSRYFLESEVSSFEQNFTTHIKNCTNKTLIDLVLKFLGQKIVRSLTLPQQRKGSSLSTSFQPKKILGFVRSFAVWPCVEDGDFVCAVKVFAQTTAFRHYLVNSSM